jgi:hypothetical protein
MITLILTGLLLYLYGFGRTLALYIGVTLTIITAVLQMVCGGGFSFLFWPEWMRTFEIGAFWASRFVERAGFELWEAPVVPLIFLLDVFRVNFVLVTTRPTVFTIGFFAFWLYCMYLMWGAILKILVRSKG